MSIVSAKTGMVVVPTTKRGAVNAVQLGFDSVPDYEFAAQLPTYSKFRKIRAATPRAPPKGTDVPVKFLQEGDDYPRAYSEEYSGEKLPAAKPTHANFRTILEAMMSNDSGLGDTARDVPFEYNKGIKPAPRAIKFDEVAEPAGQMYRT